MEQIRLLGPVWQAKPRKRNVLRRRRNIASAEPRDGVEVCWKTVVPEVTMPYERRQNKKARKYLKDREEIPAAKLTPLFIAALFHAMRQLCGTLQQKMM